MVDQRRHYLRQWLVLGAIEPDINPDHSGRYDCRPEFSKRQHYGHGHRPMRWVRYREHFAGESVGSGGGDDPILSLNKQYEQYRGSMVDQRRYYLRQWLVLGAIEPDVNPYHSDRYECRPEFRKGQHYRHGN
jgi:hypothetical protein